MGIGQKLNVSSILVIFGLLDHNQVFVGSEEFSACDDERIWLSNNKPSVYNCAGIFVYVMQLINTIICNWALILVFVFEEFYVCKLSYVDLSGLLFIYFNLPM